MFFLEFLEFLDFLEILNFRIFGIFGIFGILVFWIFWNFWIFLDFLDFFWFFGPGRVPEGSRGAFGFIWTKFQPKWSHFGPVGAHFRFPIFWKPIWGPNSSQESLGSGPIRGPGPMEAEGRHYGGRRPASKGGWEGEAPPPTENEGEDIICTVFISSIL